MAEVLKKYIKNRVTFGSIFRENSRGITGGKSARLPGKITEELLKILLEEFLDKFLLSVRKKLGDAPEMKISLELLEKILVELPE